MSSSDHQDAHKPISNTHGTKRKAEWPNKAAFISKKPRPSLETKKIEDTIFQFRTTFAGSRVKAKTSDQSLNEQFAASIRPPEHPIPCQGTGPKIEMSLPQPPLRPGFAQRLKDSRPQGAREGTKGLSEVPLPPWPQLQTPRRKAASAMARRSILASQTITGPHKDESGLEVPALTPFPIFPPMASSPTKTAAASSQQMLIDRGLAPSPEKEQHRSKKGFVKGGFAELAQNIIARSSTDFSLWSKEIVLPDGRANPYIRLEVLEVLSRNPKEAPESSAGSYNIPGIVFSVLTRCQPLDSEVDQSGLVLFSSRSPAASSRVSNIKRIDIGKEVHICEPWSEATIASHRAQSPTQTEKVLLCSRFMVK